MAFPPYSFDGSYQTFPLDVPAYRGQLLFADLDTSDGNIVDTDLVGAEILDQGLVPWSHPTALQRFLKDNHRPMLFSPMPQSQSVGGFGLPVTPMPSAATLHFHDSPPPSQEQSSCTSSSARSPRADTDMFTENTPSTPSDMSFVSSLPGAPFDPFDLHAQQFFAGMGGCPGDTLTGVSMADINPAEDIRNEWAETPPVIDFISPPQRSFTLDSQSSMSFEVDVPKTPTPIDPPRQSPGVITVAKAKLSQTQSTSILDVTTKGPYPTPSIGESEESAAEIDVATPIMLEDQEDEDDDDEDDEYQPEKKPRLLASTGRSNNKKRSAPSRPLDKMPPKRPRATSRPAAPQPARPLLSSTGSRATFSCRECPASFKDENGLQSHIKKTHTRPFICVFHFAGCQSTFASKNEWKRHVMSQHLVLTYWLCDIATCAHNKNAPGSSSSSFKPNSGRNRNSRRTSERMITLEQSIGPPLPNGAIFNRKDLYTQHLRRMHTPSGVKRSNNNKAPRAITTTGSETSSSDWEEQIRTHQSHAHRERCKLPTQMDCPANHCEHSFSGADAWDQRMEHVAKHLEKAATGAEDPVVFGGPTDPTLMDWVTSPEVAVVREVDAGKWILNNPLRSASEGRGVGRRRDVSLTASLACGSVHGTSQLMSLSFPASSSTPTVAGSENDDIVVEGGDEDAEGEEEY